MSICDNADLLRYRSSCSEKFLIFIRKSNFYYEYKCCKLEKKTLYFPFIPFLRFLDDENIEHMSHKKVSRNHKSNLVRVDNKVKKRKNNVAWKIPS